MPVNQRTLGDLQRECLQLGIVVPDVIAKNGKVKTGKREYVVALRDYYLNKKHPNGVPKHLQLMCSFESLMLADRYHAKKPDIQKEIYSSSMWGFQEKMNGDRMAIVFVKEEGLHFYSRGTSVTDFLPVEYENVYIPNREYVESELAKVFNDFILDDEVISTNPNISTVIGKRGVVTETMLQAVTALLALNKEESLRIQKEEGCPLKFCTFDCFYFDGKFLDELHMAVVQEKRELISNAIVGVMKGLGVNITHLGTVYGVEEKKKFLEDIYEAKGEGVIAKHKLGLYRTVEARSRNTWVKIKRSVAMSLTDTPYNDTLDAFVSGFGLGDEDKQYASLVGWLGFSVKLIKDDGSIVDHEIARIGSIPLEQRKEITEIGPDGVPRMKDYMLGRVAAIDGQTVTARVNRLQHARIINWRTDKNVDECTVYESFLKEMIM